jgi:hypothetical protein
MQEILFAFFRLLAFRQAMFGYECPRFFCLLHKKSILAVIPHIGIDSNNTFFLVNRTHNLISKFTDLFPANQERPIINSRSKNLPIFDEKPLNFKSFIDFQ